jgi:DNA-binding MltR family transcriptional regulator
MPKYVLPTPANLRADTRAFFSVLNDEGDFAAIVVTVAFLDACVASVLKSGLRDSSVTDKLLDPRRGHLGSFAARVDMAYALKLIDQPMYQDLLQYAEIRNMVAHHHVSVSFDDPEISAACQKLKYLLTMKNGDLEEMAFTEERLPPPRERYKFTAVYISNLLLVQAEEKERGNAA